MADVVKTLSELLARILGTLSVTSWVPAAALVMSSVVIEDMSDATPTKPLDAVRSIADYGVGKYLVVALATFAVTIALQPLQFSMIRVLEGYWGNSFPARLVGRPCRRWQRYRQQRLVGVRASEDPSAASWWLRAIQFLRDVKTKLAPELQRTESDRGELESRQFPEEPERRLPTALGNRMRAAEDRAVAKDGTPIQRLLLREYDAMPASLRGMHDLFRSRLDLYAQLAFVWLAVAAIGAASLQPSQYRAQTVAVALFGFAASYAACNTSAEGYGATLLAMCDVHDRHLDGATKSDTPDLLVHTGPIRIAK